jgi:hypothetical protein
MATLQIELEDMAGTSRWAGVLATLTSQSDNTYLRLWAASTAIVDTKAPPSPRHGRSAHCRPRRRGHPG